MNMTDVAVYVFKDKPERTNRMTKLALSDEILMKIDKPARYIGNELNSIKKDKEKIAIRFCHVLPGCI